MQTCVSLYECVITLRAFSRYILYLSSIARMSSSFFFRAAISSPTFSAAGKANPQQIRLFQVNWSSGLNQLKCEIMVTALLQYEKKLWFKFNTLSHLALRIENFIPVKLQSVNCRDGLTTSFKMGFFFFPQLNYLQCKYKKVWQINIFKSNTSLLSLPVPKISFYPSKYNLCHLKNPESDPTAMAEYRICVISL